MNQKKKYNNFGEISQKRMPINKTLLPILAPKVPPVLSIKNFENAILS